jgi:hypothetical protein
VRSSKLCLFLWLVLGAWTLLFEDLALHGLILYLAGLGALVWNRMDSRGKAYKFSVKGPAGVSASLSSKGGDD